MGASLFIGDSMITPAISVLSAVEGLKLVMRHRLVYDALHDMINKAEIHALAINAIAPSELT